jgi:GNAT superfamily N-acetyltransferase
LFKCATIGQKWTLRVERLIRGPLADGLERGESTQGFVAVESDSTIVGVIAFALDPEADDPGPLYTIHALAVVERRRRGHIATELKQLVLDECASRGATAVVSHVHRRNTPMNNLNAGLGVVAVRDPEDGEFLLSTAKLPVGSELPTAPPRKRLT